jgi:nucleotide-binding universal stress UspA family protein
MFTTILVPLDRSPFAEAALPSARWIASGTGARLHLFLAHQPVPVLAGVAEALASAPAPDLEAVTRERSYLADAASSLEQAYGESVRTNVGEGPAGTEIVEEAARIGADLIVMATHGRGALGRFWLGSVADHVVRHISVPILLVRPGELGSGAPEIRGILVPLDLSQLSMTILDPLVEFAALAQAPVTLLHVVSLRAHTAAPGVPYPIAEDPCLLDVQRANAECQLEMVAGELRLRGIAVSTRVVIASHAAAGVLDTLAEPGYDLVALATHGDSGIRRLLLGSVTSQVIRGSAKRVLVLRPPEALRPRPHP